MKIYDLVRLNNFMFKLFSFSSSSPKKDWQKTGLLFTSEEVSREVWIDVGHGRLKEVYIDQSV